MRLSWTLLLACLLAAGMVFAAEEKPSDTAKAATDDQFSPVKEKRSDSAKVVAEDPFPPGDVAVPRLQNKEMPVGDAMVIVASTTKWQIICTKKAADGRVAVFAENMLASDIVRGIVKLQGLVYRVNGNVVYIAARDEYNQGFGAEKLVIALKHAPASTVAQALDAMKAAPDAKVMAVNEVGVIILYDTPANLVALRKVVEELDQPLADATVRLSNAVASDLLRTLQSFASPIGRLSADESSNQIVITDTPGRVELMVRMCSQLDLPPVKATRQFMLRHAESTTVAEYIAGMFSLRQVGAGQVAARTAPAPSPTPVPAPSPAPQPDGRPQGPQGSAATAAASAAPASAIRAMLTSMSQSPASSAAQGTVVADPRTNSIWVTENPERIRQIGEVIEGFDQPLVTEVYKVNYIRMDVFNIEEKLAKILLSPFDHCEVDQANRFVTITSSVDKIKQALGLLKAWDSKPYQVFITGKVLAVDLGYLRELGITYDLLLNKMDEHITAFTDLKGTFPPVIEPIPRGSVEVGNLENDNFNVLLEALEKSSRTKVLSSPRVLVLDGSDALLTVATDEPYTEVTTSPGSQTTLQSVKFKPVGVTLTVTPRISGLDYIAMKVTLEVSSRKDIRGGIPVVARSMMASDFMAANGRPIVIGGLLSDEEIKVVNGVPLLKDIPVLGALFRNTRNDRTQRELVLIMTPKIIEPGREENAPSMDDIDNRLKSRGYLKDAVTPTVSGSGGGGPVDEVK